MMHAFADALPVLASFDVLGHVQRWMHSAGYPVLFGLLLSCGLGLPLPEDIPLLLAGYFVARGEMQMLPAALFAWCGIIGGDCVLYTAGRRYGLALLKVPFIGGHIKVEQIERMHVQFEKYGVWVVAVGRMFAGVRGVMVFVAGTIRFTFVHFIVADGLAAVASGGLFMGLGYYAGRKLGDLNHIHELIGQYSMRILLVLILAGLAFGAWVYWRRQQRRRPGFDPVPAGPVAEGAVPQGGDVPLPPPVVDVAPVKASAADATSLPPA